MASPWHLPSVDQVPTLPEPMQIEILDQLFEPAPALHRELLPTLKKASNSWHEFIYQSIGTQLEGLRSAARHTSDSQASAARETLDGILGSHPRLGEKKVDSASSSAEQAHLKSGSSEEETKQLAELNAAYEQAFPGLRFVVFVNGRPRADIMTIMRARIARADIDQERLESINAMLDIAWDRAKKAGAAT